MLTRIAENEQELSTDHEAAEQRQRDDLIFKQSTLVQQREELLTWRSDLEACEFTRQQEVWCLW